MSLTSALAACIGIIFRHSVCNHDCLFFLKKVVMIYQFKRDRTYRRFRQHGYSLWLSKVSI